jgi:predicted RNase H-like HicB family nuclease
MDDPENYRVLLSQKDDVWVIEVVGRSGLRSFGRTVSAAVANISKAITAADNLDHSDACDLVFAVDDETVSQVLERLRAAIRRHEEATHSRRRAIEDAIEALRAYGMSYRDIGSVIGLSQQRVAQIGSQGW